MLRRKAFLVVAFFIAGAAGIYCSQVSPDVQNKTNAVESVAQNPAPTISPIPAINPSDVPIVKKFAENYQPQSSNKAVIPVPPILPESVAAAIADLSKQNSREHKKYVVLVYLRLYRFHVEHFKQGYELGRTDQLTQEFYRLAGEANYMNAEIMSSSLALSYVDKHVELLDYPPIAAEMKRITVASKNIGVNLKNRTR